MGVALLPFAGIAWAQKPVNGYLPAAGAGENRREASLATSPAPALELFVRRQFCAHVLAPILVFSDAFV
jgi:hypothetical protein